MKRVVGSLTSTFKNAFGIMAKQAKRLGLVLAGLFVLSLKEAVDYETALTRMTKTLQATGRVSGLTRRELVKNAQALQEMSTSSETAAIAMQSMLLTFKNIGGSTFIRTTKAIIDMNEGMARASGTTSDLNATTIQLAKALNNPIKGLTRLQLIGIEFSDTQKEMIKDFVNTNRLAEAQAVILKEIESQFGGTATNIDTTAKALKQLWNTFTDFLRAFGKPFLDPIKNASKNMKKFFEDNTQLMDLFGQRVIIEFQTLSEVIKAFFSTMNDDSVDGWTVFVETMVEAFKAGFVIIAKLAGTAASSIINSIGSQMLQANEIFEKTQKLAEKEGIEFKKRGKGRVPAPRGFFGGGLGESLKDIVGVSPKIFIDKKDLDRVKELQSQVRQEMVSQNVDSAIKSVDTSKLGASIKAQIRKVADTAGIDLEKILSGRKEKISGLKFTPSALTIDPEQEKKVKSIALAAKQMHEAEIKRDLDVKIAKENATKALEHEADLLNKLDSARRASSNKLRAQRDIYVDLKDASNEFIAVQKLVIEQAQEYLDLGFEDKLITKWAKLQINIARVNSSMILSGLRDSIQGVTNASSEFFTSWMDGSKNMGDAFKDMTSRIKDIFFQMISDLVAKWVIFQLVTGIGNAFSPGAGTKFAAGAGLTNPLAKTGTPAAQGPPNPRMMAKGGITNGLSIAGEDGREAVIPLPDNRSVPVTLSGAGGSPVINVINQSSQEVTAEQGESFFEFGQMVTEVILKDLESNGPVRNNLLSLR